MKSNCKGKKEDTDSTKKYVFFSDPDVIFHRTQTFATESQDKQDCEEIQEQQCINTESSAEKQPKAPVSFDLKGLENLFSYPVQSYPFPFISAVKRKLALNDYTDVHKRTYQPPYIMKKDEQVNTAKMDFMQALKVPELSIRDSPGSQLLMAAKTDIPKETVYDALDKPTKNLEKIQRKLDFSMSDCPSITSSDNIEPLKVPNLSIASNLSRKKEHTKENFKEKENRSKEAKREDALLDFNKRSESPKYISRRDCIENASHFLPIKPRAKNFATSTTKKDNDKRHRLSNTRSSKASRDICMESKPKGYSNEPISEHSSELFQKVTVRELSRNMFDNVEHRQGKQRKQLIQPHGKPVLLKDQGKKAQEKVKPSIKSDGKHLFSNTEELEDVESITESNTSLFSGNPSCIIPISYTKQKEDSLQQWTSINMNKEEGSFTQTTTTNQTSTDNDSNDIDESILPEALLDARRISFRDENCSPQEEFHDLVTPNMNLVVKNKRRKQFTQNDVELGDTRNVPKNSSGMKAEAEQESIHVLHPTALHMQLQAELHLLQTVDESYRKVMSVENSLYNVEHEQKKELQSEQKKSNEELLAFSKAMEKNNASVDHQTSIGKSHKQLGNDSKSARPDMQNTAHAFADQTKISECNDGVAKSNKLIVKAVEVQTQTVNDIATQTDLRPSRHIPQTRCSDICGSTIERGYARRIEDTHCSLDSIEHFEDLDQIEDISVPSKLRTMSEISLHETTSSIKTETGTEISISTRDVTCSFNKYLDLEMAQLIKDEKQMYDKIQMLFKSREKTLNDRTKKLVKLEEQKRALKDTGQDSRISSVKKKQRALLLKLQQEKDEMNRLKELHKLASQERKLMLQKQRNMFNPHMSTKNILTKLKRSADCSSPRRLSGPMKGYDIRSNSSMSSLVDSDKSQHERSHTDIRLQISDNDVQFPKLDDQELSASFTELNKFNERLQDDELNGKCLYKSPKEGHSSRYEFKSKKFEEKMPRADILRIKTHHIDVESKLMPGHSMNVSEQYFFEKERHSDSSQMSQQLNKSVNTHLKSESDIILEELSRKSKSSQAIDGYRQSAVSPRERTTLSKSTSINTEIIPEEACLLNQDTMMSKSSQVSEDIQQSSSRSSKRSSKTISSEIQSFSKKGQSTSDTKSNSKRKSLKCQKNKSSSSTISENTSRPKSGSQVTEEFLKQNSKHNSVRSERELIESDYCAEDTVLDSTGLNETSFQSISRHSETVKNRDCELVDESDNNYEAKENMCKRSLSKNIGTSPNYSDSQEKGAENGEDVASKSQVSRITISRHSSGENERNYSKSVVVRSQGSEFKTSKKLEQILNARETALANRRNCIEEWMAWHAKLREEEDRVARMEQATLKLVTTTSNVFSQQERSVCPLVDTTISSDTSDVEGRIELLTERLHEQRMEMSRLKREARKQAKQKLRAVEANLLNQIQKYDTTIYEMKKKLESKKGFDKDSEKSFGEFKSWADFKVPEIPVRRIQDICKSAELLRSRSESDLLSSKKQQKGTGRNVHDEILRQVPSSIVKEKRGKSEEVKKQQRSELHNFARTETHHSAQSIVDECISEQIEDEKSRFGTTLYTSDEIPTEKYTYSTSVDKITEDIKTDISSAKFDSEKSAISESYKTENKNTIQSDSLHNETDLDTDMKRSSTKRDIEYSQTFTEISDNCSENINTEIQSASQVDIESNIDYDVLDFSKTLDYVEFNHKNLNKNISTLENDVRALSELLSRKKPDEEVRDATKLCLISHDEENNKHIIKCNTEKKMLLRKEDFSKSDSSEHVPDNESLRSCSDIGVRKSTRNNARSLIPIVMPKEDTPLHEISQDIIDYEAKSKEILNEIEKSIVSEHIKNHDLSSANASYERTNFNSGSAVSLKSKATSENSSTSTPIEEDLTRSKNVSGASDIGNENVCTQDIKKNSLPQQKVLNICSSEVEKVNESLHSNEEMTIINSLNVTSDVNEINAKLSDLNGSRNSNNHASSMGIKLISLPEKSHLQENKEELINLQVTSVNETNQIEQNAWSSKVETENVDSHSTDTKGISPSEYDKKSYFVNDQKTVSITNGNNSSEAHRNTSAVGDDQDWTISDSFSIQQNAGESDWEESLPPHSKYDIDEKSDAHDIFKSDDDSNVKEEDRNIISDIEDVSMFIPKGESTNIEMHGEKFDETLSDFPSRKPVDELDDILDVIAKESNEKVCLPQEQLDAQSNTSKEINRDSVASDKIGKSSEEQSPIVQAHISVSHDTTVLDDYQSKKNETSDIKSQNLESEDGHVINIEVHLEVKENIDLLLKKTESRDIIITELEADSIEGEILPEVQLDTKVELAKDDFEDVDSAMSQRSREDPKLNDEIEIYETLSNEDSRLDAIHEHDTSDGEQLDNLVEVCESKLFTIEKEINESTERVSDSVSPEVTENVGRTLQHKQSLVSPKSSDNRASPDNLIAISESGQSNKTFDILKDPEYEDISEESLEVSEILEKTEHSKSVVSQKVSNAVESYQSAPNSEEVLRILDAIVPKSAGSGTSQRKVSMEAIENAEPLNLNTDSASVASSTERSVEEIIKETSAVQCLESTDVESVTGFEQSPREELKKTHDSITTHEDVLDVYNKSEEIDRLQYETSDKPEQDASSDSNEGGDSRVLSEVESDSPRDTNDAKLGLDESSEKEIAVMINELKASLDQPGLDNADLEAKVLHLQQLQIELEIKALEAKGMTYYVREIPNKPPPPYTPPGESVRIPVPPSSPSPPPPPAVVPSSLEELTSFTEKATMIIFDAKSAGEDIMTLEPPLKIFEPITECNEAVSQDKSVYNTFLFDLCKEIIAEVYKSEYEKPGPSWTKPNVATKLTIRLPKTLNELKEYVNKEVATLFGFKTKLQRENMVMQWIRKRRDRVDELLAREAQAEEDEWTKFHHDEVTVKNSLTIAVFDTLIMETVKEVKIAYAKKRKVMSMPVLTNIPPSEIAQRMCKDDNLRRATRRFRYL